MNFRLKGKAKDVFAYLEIMAKYTELQVSPTALSMRRN